MFTYRVRLYDNRVPEEPIQVFTGHSDWVMSVQIYNVYLQSETV